MANVYEFDFILDEGPRHDEKPHHRVTDTFLSVNDIVYHGKPDYDFLVAHHGYPEDIDQGYEHLKSKLERQQPNPSPLSGLQGDVAKPILEP